MLKKIFITLSVLLSISTSAIANVFNYPQKLSYIAPQIPKMGSVFCKFSQEKYLPNSHIVLKSSGNFKFIKNKGVTFYTTYPIKSTTSYTNREYKQINNIIRAISSKSYSKLEKDFKFYFQKKSNNWDLGLIPKQNSNISQYLKSIEIEGNNDISKIEIITKDLTKTTIKFSI